MEYYQYFRLKGSPFQPASPKSTVYFSPTHLAALTTLESGLLGELTGLTMLTGEAGTGKTTLIYALLQRDYKRVRIAHIVDPKLSFLEMMRIILPQLNLYTAGSTKLDYLNTLDHLLELHGKEERIAIVVDEAQVLSDDVLEELRLLSNRGQRNDRCLQLILVGQPELAERLKKPELRQLNQRISSRGVLKPLDPRQAAMYVECMLSAQGGKASTIFEPGALERLLRRSDGIPRKINMLCHSALQAAFYAGQRRVSVRTAKKVAAEYQDSVRLTGRKPGTRDFTPLLGAALAALLLVGFFYPVMGSEWLTNPAGAFSAALGQRVPLPNRAARRQKASRLLHEARVNPALAPHPVAMPLPAAAGATGPAAAAPAVANPATTAPLIAPAMRIVPSAPAAATANQKTTAAPAARLNQITVRYGDTIEKIAIRYFGSNSGISQLVEANPHLTNINQLSVGQIIYLPADANRKASHNPTVSAPAVLNASVSPAP